MTGNYVYKKDLEELYGQELLLTADFNHPVNKKVQLTKEKYRVEVVSKMGKISLVRTLSQSGTSTRFAVLTDTIKTETVLPPKELFSPILDIYHKDQYLFVNGGLYIHYPVLEIKNSLGMKHTIYDLIVYIPLSQNCVIGHEVQGCRTSLSQKEINAGYVHSHLHRNEYRFNHFCRGGGSAFEKFLLSLGKVVDAEEFELFLIQMKEYLSWESLEGNPYISIKTFFGSMATPTENNSTQHFMGLGSSALLAMQSRLIPAILTAGRTTLKTCFMRVEDVWMFDPGLDVNAWLEFEANWVGDTALSSVVCNWNPATMLYNTAGAGSGNVSFPSIELGSNIKTAFKLEPKLLPETTEAATTTNYIKRFSTTLIQRCIESVNDKLILTQYNE